MIRRLALLFAVFAIVFAAFLAASAYLFVWPEDDHLRSPDALVVLGPGPNGERWRKAADLLRDYPGLPLVVSEPKPFGRHGQLRAWCSEGRATCFRAEPFTTRGEARQVARLARRRNWRSLIVVTSRYHVVRARLLYRRCYPGRVMVVGAPPGKGRRELLSRAMHEWGGLLYALTFARDC